MRCLTVFSFVCNVLTCLLLCTATGTDRWKEHLDVFKMSRKYIGLWRACLLVEEGNYAKMPPYYDCDKDFLRPHRIEPPGNKKLEYQSWLKSFPLFWPKSFLCSVGEYHSLFYKKNECINRITRQNLCLWEEIGCNCNCYNEYRNRKIFQNIL